VLNKVYCLTGGKIFPRCQLKPNFTIQEHSANSPAERNLISQQHLLGVKDAYMFHPQNLKIQPKHSIEFVELINTYWIKRSFEMNHLLEFCKMKTSSPHLMEIPVIN
jgi:hypothetical protein